MCRLGTNVLIYYTGKYFVPDSIKRMAEHMARQSAYKSTDNSYM
jgi:hypothetical protein